MKLKALFISITFLMAFGVQLGHSQCASPINTIMNFNNGQDGNMFNVTAINDIFIDSVWCNFDPGTIQEVEIWWRSGTVVGNANSANGWTMIDSVLNLTSAGTNNFTKVPIHINLFVPAGTTVGLYVTRAFVGGAGPYMRYTNGPGGSTAGQNYTSNTDLTISYAYGKDYPFATSFNPRIWNGRLFYHCCPPPPNIQMSAAPTQLCNSDTFTYSVVPYQYAESYTWSAGQSGTIVSSNNDSTTVQIVFNGNVVNDTVCISMADTCSSIDTCIAVTINPPTAYAGPDTSICATHYELQGNNGLGEWSVVGGAGVFANANQYNTVVSGLAPGVNTMRWSVGNANCDTVFDEVNITVNPIAVAGINVSDGCDDNQIQFTSTSYALGGNIVNWDWDVNGDGTFDYSTSTFNHIYTAPGVYACTLIATANLGCKDTVVDTVTVFPNPVVDFEYDPDCEGSPMAFTDLTTISSGSLAAWDWQFGDNSSSQAQNPAHVYATDGFYVVTLTVTSGFGCEGVKADSVEVFSIPDMDFFAPNTCVNDTFFFSDSSISTQGNINYWEWDFGDGSAASYNQHTFHLYNFHGTYNVKLQVQTDKGCTNTIVKPVDAYPIPTPVFDQLGVCEEQTVRFTDVSELDNMFGSKLVQWEWDFGDGNTASNETVGNFYQEPGYYIVNHTPYTNYGCHVTQQTEILIRPKPRANVLVVDDEVCAGNVIKFRDETYFDYTYDTIGVVDWEWRFGDGATSSEQHPTHVYQVGGDYDAELRVETTYGCIDSASRIVVNYHNPKVDFRADTLEGCSPHCVTFIDESVLASGADLAYRWVFGDGGTGDEVNPTYCYSIADGLESETFYPELKVISPHGCEDHKTFNKEIVVHSNPIADFEIGLLEYSMLDPVVEISNYSVGGDAYSWDFGDSTTSSVADPISHEYTASGDYQITLTTNTDFGCEDNISRKVTIIAHQTIYIPGGFSPNADGINDFFEVKGEDVEMVRLWIYDRWGHEVFFGENEEARWDGRYEGQIMPIGNYAFVLEYKKVNQVKETLTGNFVISSSEDN